MSVVPVGTCQSDTEDPDLGPRRLPVPTRFSHSRSCVTLKIDIYSDHAESLQYIEHTPVWTIRYHGPKVGPRQTEV